MENNFNGILNSINSNTYITYKNPKGLIKKQKHLYLGAQPNFNLDWRYLTKKLNISFSYPLILYNKFIK